MRRAVAISTEGSGLRIGPIILIATLLIAGTNRSAPAKSVKRHPKAHETAFGCRGMASAKPIAFSLPTARLGPMRYYGGPKSPMWRGPVAN